MGMHYINNANQTSIYICKMRESEREVWRWRIFITQRLRLERHRF